MRSNVMSRSYSVVALVMVASLLLNVMPVDAVATALASSHEILIGPRDGTVWDALHLEKYPDGEVKANALMATMNWMVETKKKEGWSTPEFESRLRSALDTLDAKFAGRSPEIDRRRTELEREMQNMNAITDWARGVPIGGDGVASTLQLWWKRDVYEPAVKDLDEESADLANMTRHGALIQMRDKSQIARQLRANCGDEPAVCIEYNRRIGSRAGSDIFVVSTDRMIATHPDNPAVKAIKEKGRRRSDGTIVIQLSDLRTEIQQQFRAVGDMIGESRDLLKQINAKQDVILKWIDSEEKRRADEAAAGDLQRRFTAAGSSISILSTLIGFVDPKLGQQIQVVGQSALQIGQSIAQYAGGAAGLAKLDSLGAVIMTGNILAAVANIVSLFNQGPTTEQMILQEIGALRNQVNDLRNEMHSRFDRIDRSLNVIYASMMDNFLKIQVDVGRLLDDVTEIRKQLADLMSRLERIEANLLRYLDVTTRFPLTEAIDLTIGYRDRVGEGLSFDKFVTHESLFYTWANTLAALGTEQPVSGRSYRDRDVLNELTTWPLDANILYLNTWLSSKGWPTFAPAGGSLPNPRTWSLASRAYAQMQIDERYHAARFASPRNGELLRTGEKLKEALRGITLQDGKANVPLFAGLLGNYQQQLDQLNVRLKALEDDHVKRQKTSVWRGGEYPPGDALPVDLWTYVQRDFQTGYVPSTLTSDMPPLTSGPPLPAPTTLSAWVPDVIRFTDYFKPKGSPARLTTKWSARWTLTDFADSPNVNGRFWYGGLRITIDVYYGDANITSVMVTEPRRDSWIGVQVCEGIPCQQPIGDINFNQPAEEAAPDAWKSQLKSQFENGGAEIGFCGPLGCVPTSWLPDAADEVNRDLREIRRGIYSQILREMGTADQKPLMDAVDGARELIRAFVSLGMPRALNGDDRLRLLVSETQGLPGSPTAVSLYGEALAALNAYDQGASEQPYARTALTALAAQRKAELDTVLKEHLQRIEASPERETHPLIETTTMMLTFADSLRSITRGATGGGYSVTVEKAGPGEGEVTVAPPANGIHCGVDCSGIFPAGATVTLVAAASAGSAFQRWGGACTPAGTGSTCSLVMNDSAVVSATFNRAVVGVSVVRRPAPNEPNPLRRRLVVTVSARAGCEPLRTIRFGIEGRPLDNAIVDVLPGGPTGQTQSFAFSPPAPTSQLQFELYRAREGAATVPLVVVDGCGEWPTFVGGGPAAF